MPKGKFCLTPKKMVRLTGLEPATQGLGIPRWLSNVPVRVRPSALFLVPKAFELS